MRYTYESWLTDDLESDLSPYIVNNEGESKTASFLREFLPSAYSLVGKMPSSMETLQTSYKKSSQNPLKLYIGRAAHSHSTIANSNEESWCILADVERAARYLTEEQQGLLGLLCEGLEKDQISDIYEVSNKTAEAYINEVITTLASTLDTVGIYE